MKLLDDNQLKQEANANALGIKLKNRVFEEGICVISENPRVETDYNNLRWHEFHNFEPGAMFNNIQTYVFPFIKQIGSGKDTAFSRYMKDTVFLIPTAKVLAKVVDGIDAMDMNNKDIMGDVYEYLLGKIAAAGENGQFRTPRHIISMMVQLMKPTLKDKILDPAMGSAGFLFEASNYITANYNRELMRAENAQYYKSGKISDPFYLSEDERREVIENVCVGEDKLDFWGFELGGINPNRFKTLCKIQKQYPDAEIYEIQGADKVHTLAKSSHGEEYVSNFHFTIFKRFGIDLDAVFDDSPLLTRYRSSFVILPELDEGSSISSTEVRNRFYGGEDYSDIVPEAVVEIMSKYKPSDFEISFAERMKVMMASGRFGRNNARKEVYRLNTRLFNAWKAGTQDVELGDYKAFLDGAKLYKRPYSVDGIGKVYDSCETGCINVDCMELAEQLIADGYNPAILNLASAKKPGGGYRDGMGAQEESLCYSSNLSLSLYEFGDSRYINIRESGVPVREIGYTLDMCHGGIYSPSVTFFRNNMSKYYTIKEKPFKCDVITVAALSFNGRSHYADIDELSFMADDGGFTPEGREVMLNKIRTIFRMGVEHGKDSLILGAFGCGAYALLPSAVAPLFRVVMEEPEFNNKFKLLVFAILEHPRRPHGFDGHFAPFYEEFGEYHR